MTSTIRTNMDAVRAHNLFNANNAQMTKAFNNVASGLKISSVQDSPTNWAISEKMRERLNSLNQAQQNIQNDTAMMKTAEGGVANTVDILRTMKARLIQAKDSATTNQDRQNIAKELSGLFDQINDNAKSIKYNGIDLLQPSQTAVAAPSTDSEGEDNSEDVDGESEGDTESSFSSGTDALSVATTEIGKNSDGAKLTFQIGDSTVSKVTVTLHNMDLSGLGLTKLSEVIKNIAKGTTDTIETSEEESEAEEENEGTSTTSTSADATDINDYLVLALAPSDKGTGTSTDDERGTADHTIAVIDNALNVALKAATEIGSLENRLGYTADNVSTQIENLQASDSAIRDSDMSKEISNYMKWQVLSQASQYMLAQSNQNAFSVLNLLQ